MRNASAGAPHLVLFRSPLWCLAAVGSLQQASSCSRKDSQSRCPIHPKQDLSWPKREPEPPSQSHLRCRTTTTRSCRIRTGRGGQGGQRRASDHSAAKPAAAALADSPRHSTDHIRLHRLRLPLLPGPLQGCCRGAADPLAPRRRPPAQPAGGSRHSPDGAAETDDQGQRMPPTDHISRAGKVHVATRRRGCQHTHAVAGAELTVLNRTCPAAGCSGPSSCPGQRQCSQSGGCTAGASWRGPSASCSSRPWRPSGSARAPYRREPASREPCLRRRGIVPREPAARGEGGGQLARHAERPRRRGRGLTHVLCLGGDVHQREGDLHVMLPPIVAESGKRGGKFTKMRSLYKVYDSFGGGSWGRS